MVHDGRVSPRPPDPHTQLDAAIDERRQQLGMTWAEVATEAKITVETLRAIRRGKNEPSPLTKRGLERALRWRNGSIDAIYSGRRPTPEDASTQATQDAPQSPGANRSIDIDTYVPQTPTERVLLEILQAQQREREEVNRKLETINEKLDRLAGDDQGEGQARTA